jgi:hypothetical protein
LEEEDEDEDQGKEEAEEEAEEEEQEGEEEEERWAEGVEGRDEEKSNDQLFNHFSDPVDETAIRSYTRWLAQAQILPRKNRFSGQ